MPFYHILLSSFHRFLSFSVGAALDIHKASIAAVGIDFVSHWHAPPRKAAQVRT
jgi:hypothetical protein